jgi:MtfA peptidase
VFSWMSRSRRSTLREWGLEPQDRQILDASVWQYSRLPADLRRLLDGWIRVFITEKNWEGCGGLKLERAMQLTVAAQAGLMALGWSEFYFDTVTSILIYPNAYLAPEQKHHLSGEFFLVGDSVREGESWPTGPIVLSWKEVQASAVGWNEGGNLVMHEFTHQIDMLQERRADGAPPLPDKELARWIYVYKSVRERMHRAVARGEGFVLDPYGLENDSEMFAVSVEAFFQHSDWLAEDEPELFELLSQFFKLDPRPWGAAPDRP